MTAATEPVPVEALPAHMVAVAMWPLLASGRIRPVVQQLFPLARAADAHRLLEANKARGKLAPTVD